MNSFSLDKDNLLFCLVYHTFLSIMTFEYGGRPIIGSPIELDEKHFLQQKMSILVMIGTIFLSEKKTFL